MRILLAEDERDLNRIITMKLKSEGYSVDSCFDGAEALDCIAAADYDAVILDVMMPGADGFTVLRRMREMGKKAPTLFLTARDSVNDKVHGLDLGANDYMVKPFSFPELMARIRAMTRGTFGLVGNVLTAGDVTLDCAAHTVKRGGIDIQLSSKEYSMLEYLMRNKGIVLSREKLENHVWNFDYEGGTNVVDVYISYLRKKLDAGRDGTLIQTVRGKGYMIRVD